MNQVNLSRGESGIATVTIDRQKQLNALDDETVGLIRQIFEEIAADDSIRVVILTRCRGSGFRCRCRY